MKNTIITGIIAATILIAVSPSSTAQTQERDMVTRAKSIKLPEFKLDDVTLTEAVQQLSAAAKQSDPSKEINFLITEPATTAASPKITLALKKVTVAEAAERIAIRLHELWIESDQEQTFCLAGPLGDSARASLLPGAKLAWTVEAGSYVEAMTKYYEHMGWGLYKVDHESDYEPYED